MSALERPFRRAAWHLRHGPPRARPGFAIGNLLAALRELLPFHFDRTWGVDPTGALPPGALFAPDALADRRGYQATTPPHWRAVLRAVPVSVDRLALVDVGCGKGRVLLLALRHPFRSILGVEADPGLASVARANLVRWRGARRCTEVAVIEGGATALAWPRGPVLVFFYNSFAGASLDALLDRLEAAHDAGTRPLLFVYSNPVEEDRVRARPRFRPLLRSRSRPVLLWPGNRTFALFMVEGATADSRQWPSVRIS